MHYNIEFYGYTWDDFFPLISDKEGVLVVYNGSLDNEGTLQMREILFVDYGKRLGDIYFSDTFQTLKTDLGKNGMLFYSYTPATNSNGKQIKDALIKSLNPRYNQNYLNCGNVELNCKGACALFPKHILAE